FLCAYQGTLREAVVARFQTCCGERAIGSHHFQEIIPGSSRHGNKRFSSRFYNLACTVHFEQREGNPRVQLSAGLAETPDIANDSERSPEMRLRGSRPPTV